MVIYTCDLCSKTFADKSRYTKHINRKFPCCQNKIHPESSKSLKNITPNHPKWMDTISQHKTTQHETTSQHASSQHTTQEHTENICINCNKKFSNKYNLDKHIRLKRCKAAHIISQYNIDELIEKINLLEKKINNNTINNNTINNNTNTNTNSNNTTNNNITNNNYIIQFGHEYKTDGLTNDEIMKVINKGWNALCESIKLTHFNSRLPQLHNIYIPDKKFKTISIFNNNLFELNKMDNVLYGLVDNHINKLKKYLKMDLPYEDNKSGIVNQLLKKIDIVYDDDNSLKFKNDDNISEIMYYLYNNRNMVIKHYEKYFKEISKL